MNKNQINILRERVSAKLGVEASRISDDRLFEVLDLEMSRGMKAAANPDPQPVRARNRRPIYVSGCGVQNNNLTKTDYVLNALCDDGTIWEMIDRTEGWYRLSDIPTT